MRTIIIDPGHGMGNKRAGRFDPGAISNGVREADVVMDWANELRDILRARKYRVIRTRAHPNDAAAISQRARIAREYGGDIMLSLHCNSHNGSANGTETFYRGAEHREKAKQITDAVCSSLGTRSRGAKVESQSQHGRLAVMSFQPCFLLEIGFLDHAGDRAKMLSSELRRKACEALADTLG